MSVQRAKILDYETPRPGRPFLQRFIGRVFDPGWVICCVALVLILLIPIVGGSERPMTIVIAVALLMFIFGMRDERPLT